MYLFFDTETTGLPRNWRASLTDFDNWPRLVQIAWILCDEQGNEIESANYIVKPNGFIIPDMVVKVHGITTERALSEGIELKEALQKFMAVLAKAKVLIAHNIDFDEKIVAVELLRENFQTNLASINKICTKEISTDFCKLPGRRGGYKWPTLAELHFTLFNCNYEDAHDAGNDVKACQKSFFELQKRGVISLEQKPLF